MRFYLELRNNFLNGYFMVAAALVSLYPLTVRETSFQRLSYSWASLVIQILHLNEIHQDRQECTPFNSEPKKGENKERRPLAAGPCSVSLQAPDP
ncbi:hypothetical protein Y1Q_0000697 [Alligator mississippiensis]|uniref:Uncharacterized protein n=1 Tax=Alligator mississippiensis TaxID=8496 RepID=A0A151MC26_ALLMI|nr:hypothetical protein Y1Q_0000697 [Alligator mississippiensis]